MCQSVTEFCTRCGKPRRMLRQGLKTSGLLGVEGDCPTHSRTNNARHERWQIPSATSRHQLAQARGGRPGVDESATVPRPLLMPPAITKAAPFVAGGDDAVLILRSEVSDQHGAMGRSLLDQPHARALVVGRCPAHGAGQPDTTTQGMKTEGGRVVGFAQLGVFVDHTAHELGL